MFSVPFHDRWEGQVLKKRDLPILQGRDFLSPTLVFTGTTSRCLRPQCPFQKDTRIYIAQLLMLPGAGYLVIIQHVNTTTNILDDRERTHLNPSKLPLARLVEARPLEVWSCF